MQPQINQDSDLKLDLELPMGGSLKSLPGKALNTGNLPVLDLHSSAPLPPLQRGWATKHSPTTRKKIAPANTLSPDSKPAEGSLWLEGDVLMCGCPDCKAPMSIRLWLMVADCWQCATSIELSEEQIKEADHLIRKHGRSRKKNKSHKKATLPSKAPGDLKPRKQEPFSRTASRGTQKKRFREEPDPPPRTIPPPVHQAKYDPQPSRAKASIARPRMRNVIQARNVHAWLNDIFELTPAWLVSLVLHFVVLTLLALLTIEEKPGKQPEILLSATVDRIRREGGEIVLDPTDRVKFDLPLPNNIDLKNKKQLQAVQLADQDARELRIDPNTPDPRLPDLSSVKQRITNASSRQTFAARDPRVRIEMVQQEGGTTFTEAAVARSLRWMAKHQNKDGSWSLHAFHQAARCNCKHASSLRSDAAGTSLVLLPFLGAGQSHLTGRYSDTVSKGLRWLIDHQKENGDLRNNSSGNSGMYAHGQAAIVLCEAYAMEGDEELKQAAQKGIDFIVSAQHIGGGWRYRPGQAGDTSLFGWQLMALQSARVAGLNVPEQTMLLADQYLDSVATDGGSQYSYMRKQRPTPAMTAEALLCRMYLGWTFQRPELIHGIDYLVDSHPPSAKQPNIYYWYYATQAMHHAGGEQWERWNLKMRDILVNSQETRGHQAGSWTPRSNHDHAGGRLYTTALATCTLEVYYRHLPIFRQIDLK